MYGNFLRENVMKEQAPTVEKVVKKRGKIRRGLAWTFKPMVDVKGWVGFENIKTSTRSVVGLAKSVFIPRQSERSETFEEAMQRLNLTEKSLKKQIQQYNLFVFCFILMAIGVLCYALYLVFLGSLAAFLLAMVVCCLILAQAFRFHFWVFQMKQRRLGCSLREWYDSKAIGKKQ
jgi:intracellular multiplication protein IcmV